MKLPNPKANPDIAAQLWDESVKLVGLGADEAGAPGISSAPNQAALG